MHELCGLRCVLCCFRSGVMATRTNVHARRRRRSTIYLLVIGTIAVQGIISAGSAVEPPASQRDVFAAIWVVRARRVRHVAWSRAADGNKPLPPWRRIA